MGTFLDFAGILVKGISIAIEDAKKQEGGRIDLRYGNQDIAKTSETVKDDLIGKEESSIDESRRDRTTQKETIEIFTDLAKKALTENNKFTIRGFGSFVIKDHKPRKARNPRTGEPINVPARKSVGFKMGKDLEELVDNMVKEEQSQAQG
ncbi:MAG: HU family DNA-binding protein [Nitrospirae bacterium]|uniref:HU family DNA-binding protein n=1 Tax=Candidatus Magnetobacterium casense TaxID=1455061 RepID=UPI000698DFEA|nr:HU family DNA-binding protein [Candidatus Magnetobacterium casensis]MBF0337351.1 HU family DNA-binding protein [Nitrospirota bacterium]